MSWSDRRALLRGLALAGVAALTGGCFRPMLARDGSAAPLIGRVALPATEDRFSYYLTRTLAERLGEPRSPDFRLEVDTRLERERLAITQDDAVTRISLRAVADWALYRAGESRPLLSERVVSQSGYNSTASLFATREARRDIERRLARDLGERIALRLLARADEISAGAGS